MPNEARRRRGQLVINFCILTFHQAQKVKLFLLGVRACNHMLSVVKVHALNRFLLQYGQLFDLLLRTVQLFLFESKLHGFDACRVILCLFKFVSEEVGWSMKLSKILLLFS
jgi:hypothetical protein